MQLFGHRTRVVTYMMSNNIIVERVFRHDPGVMRCVCLADLRVVIVLGGRAGILHSGQLHM